MFQSVEVIETGILTQIGMSVNRYSASRDVDTIGIGVAFSSWNRKHTKKCLKTKEFIFLTRQKVQKLTV